MDTNAVEQRWNFVLDFESEQWSMVELCERYGITRPSGYKWLRRYRAGDVELLERSRAPHGCPHRTPARVEELLLAARREYGWGAKKLLGVLTKRHPTITWPARSTVNDILERHGMLRKHRRRKKWVHPGAAPLETTRPAQVWPADFKGQFRIGDGAYCYPLTITDHFSRALLGCDALKSVRTQGVKPAFRQLFLQIGLPEAIRTDNGPPFASTGIHGLCELNVWWMQLAIVPSEDPTVEPARERNPRADASRAEA